MIPSIRYTHYDLLQQMVADGMVSVQKHSIFNYFIYNYTAECSFSKTWNSATRDARGLILDGNGNIIAKPFPKFWNMEEHPVEDIPWHESYSVYEKLDGSLGISYVGEDGVIYIATRGSFQSEQAVEAMSILRAYDTVSAESNTISLSEIIKRDRIDNNLTYLFEIIYPQNRIVVDYGNFSALVLLGAERIDATTRMQSFVAPEETNAALELPWLSCAVTYEDIDLSDKTGKKNSEGYVVRFANGFIMKVKLAEYVRLHSLLTNFSNLDIWRCLRAGDGIEDKLEAVPDEFYDWVKQTINHLHDAYDDVMLDVLLARKKLPFHATRKEKAEILQKKYPPHIRAIVFKLMDGYRETAFDLIWRYIRPVYSKPFYQSNTQTD